MLDTAITQRLNNIEETMNLMLSLLRKTVPEHLTVKETAKLLRCSQSKIRDLIRLGDLKFIRLGKSEKSTILIKRSEIERLLT